MISCKTFFQLTVAALKENLNLQLPLRFYISAMFLFERAFVSEQIAEYRLEISDRFITKWFCSSGLKQFGKFQYWTILYDFKKTQRLGSFAWEAIVCITNVRAETFRDDKKYEDKA